MHSTFGTAFAAAILLGIASTAPAQETEKMDMDMMQGCMHGMKMMDTDADDAVSKEEFTQAHEEMFAAMDEDGDGKLDGDELKMMMEGMQHHGMKH